MAESPPPSHLTRWTGRARRFVVHDILHADDPPHRLALGIALGMFIGFQPIFGFQMVAVVCLSWLLRANKLVGTPIVWISNPATAIPIYYWNYVVGASILGEERIGRQWWSELASPPAGWWSAVSFYWSRLAEVAVPLCLGCAVVGIVTAYPTYLVCNYLIRSYRLRRWGQLTPPDASLSKQAAEPTAESTESVSSPPC